MQRVFTCGHIVDPNAPRSAIEKDGPCRVCHLHHIFRNDAILAKYLYCESAPGQVPERFPEKVRPAALAHLKHAFVVREAWKTRWGPLTPRDSAVLAWFKQRLGPHAAFLPKSLIITLAQEQGLQA